LGVLATRFSNDFSKFKKTVEDICDCNGNWQQHIERMCRNMLSKSALYDKSTCKRNRGHPARYKRHSLGYKFMKKAL